MYYRPIRPRSLGKRSLWARYWAGYLATDRQNWSLAHYVSSIGHVAHVTTAFVGVGMSAVTRGVFLLVVILKEHGVGVEAVEEYGKGIFPCAIGARSGRWDS